MKMETNSEVELTGIRQIPENEHVVKSSEKTNTNGDIVDAVVLKPGTKIRPQIEEEDVVRLAERLYGITTGKIKELVSYDDRNFLIHVDT